MMPKVTVIDYGIGNLLSVRRAFEYCGADVILTDSPKLVENAERLILPGVGAFGDGMAGLAKLNLIESIQAFALKERPFLGICLGMQMMMQTSQEFGTHRGLSLIHGDVAPISPRSAEGKPHKIPHIGWSELRIPREGVGWAGTALASVAEGTSVYFVHSFHCMPTNKEHLLAECQYNGISVTASIRKGYLHGCQFHPEKSGFAGLKIVRAFIDLK